MNKKISLIEHDNGWGWYVLEYGGGVWYNIASGHEASYEAACTAAREAYDDCKAEDKG